PMPGRHRIGVEVRDDDGPTRTTHARKLGVRGVELADVPDDEPAPDYVERRGGEWQCSQMRGGHRRHALRGLKHLRYGVDADGEPRRCAPQATADAAAGVQQPATGDRCGQCRDQPVLEIADRRLRLIAWSPQSIAFSNGQHRYSAATRRWPYAWRSSGTRWASRRTVRSARGSEKCPRAQRPRACTWPSVRPQPCTLVSCTDGNRLLSTSVKSSTRSLSRRSSQGTCGSSCVIHDTHSGCVHSSRMVGVTLIASTLPYVPRRCGVGV